MAALSQDTYLNQDTPLTVIGGGAAISTFSTLTTSSLNVTGELIANSVVSGNISSIFGEFDEVYASSISTLGLYLDGNLLTTAGTGELLLNGIPIATTSNISSLADWSFDPAVSTLNMNGNSTINSTGYFGTGTVSTLDLQSQSAEVSTLGANAIGALAVSASTMAATDLITSPVMYVSSLTAENIVTQTLTAISTIHSISSISSVTIEAQSATFSSINGTTFPSAPFNNSTFAQAFTSSLQASTLTSGPGPTDDLNMVGTRYINMATQGMSTTVDGGSDVFTNSFYRVTAQNGAAGEITMTANPGYAGNYGRINLTANGGTLAGAVGVGGLVEINANTPVGTLSNATSAIKLNAAGINSYAGAVPSVGSLLGYNFIYGTLGVNLSAGLPPGGLPNTPGTTYLYGTNGVVSGSPVYAYNILGYWNGVATPSNLLITGRQTIAGNSQVVLSNVDSIYFDSGYGALTGVSSINNISYPPPPSPYVLPADITVSSVTAANYVSTADLVVSSINGQEYLPGGVPPNLELSTLIAAEYVSTAVLTGVSSIAGGENLDIRANNVNVVGTNVALTDTGGAGFQVVGGLSKIGGGSGTLVQGDFNVSSLANVSSITGANLSISADSGNVVLTKNTGLIASGSVNPDTDNAFDLGFTGFAWNNLYANIANVSTVNSVNAINADTTQTFNLTQAGNNDLNISSFGNMNINSEGALNINGNNGMAINMAIDVTAPMTTHDVNVLTDNAYSLGLPALGYANVYARNGYFSTISTVSEIAFDTTSVAAITGVSTINGQAFFPGGTAPNLTLSSLIVAGGTTLSTVAVKGISTVANLDMTDGSLIRGGAAGGVGLINVNGISATGVNDMLITTQSPGILLLGGRNGEVELNIGINISTTGDRMAFRQVAGQNVGALAGISSINAIPFASFIANNNALTVSSLTAANYVSTASLNGISSINGQPFANGGVTSINTSGTGNVTIAAGTNINVSTVGSTITINQINQPISSRASSTSTIGITATTSGTAQTLGTLTLATTAVYDLDVFACIVFTTNTNTIVDMHCFVTIDGSPVGQTFSSSLGGSGHFLTFPVQCSLLSASAASHTILIKGFASATANLTMNSYQLTAIGNLA